jgi:hypothetical protein
MGSQSYPQAASYLWAVMGSHGQWFLTARLALIVSGKIETWVVMGSPRQCFESSWLALFRAPLWFLLHLITYLYFLRLDKKHYP